MTADTLDALLAHEQIRQLAARYALALDARDLDALVELYVDDVRVGEQRGRETLRAFYDAAMRDVGVTILFVGNHVIELIDEDRAEGWVYCQGEIEVGDRWIRQAILYHDRYRRRDGRWYFAAQRGHRLWYGVDQPTNPLLQEPANWPERHVGRGELPEVWPSWTQFWGDGPTRIDPWGPAAE